ncbi:MAG: hydrogenase expression/formation protein HypE [Bacteroidales bacterium]|jgi:hydrogenase expression/formation protein HypE|nr:hydrogenase expression/formation protein HypE [Bacteroidales bacterium]
MIYSEDDRVLLGHGSGGILTSDLISQLFLHYFKNDILEELSDSAFLQMKSKKISFTTDSFVVDPLFFPGGDIGKLAVCGTINDLAVSGAKPMFLSCGFIIEEGFSLSQLEKIVRSMAEEAEKAQVKIVTGDTKVVAKGQCDKLFINTSGIGKLPAKYIGLSKAEYICKGDKIIINGSLGDHSISVLSARNSLKIQANLVSDCAILNELIYQVLDNSRGVKFMRDATRGGLATVLYELAENKKYGIAIDENSIPVKDTVRGVCELLGFDPLYLANEGKVVMIVAEESANEILKIMKRHPLGKESCIIGEVSETNPGLVWLNTQIGGKRMVDKLSGEQLPRIC